LRHRDICFVWWKLIKPRNILLLPRNELPTRPFRRAPIDRRKSLFLVDQE